MKLNEGIKKYGLIDKTGKEISSVKYHDISSFINGKIAVTKFNNKYGLINLNGKEVLDNSYDRIFIDVLNGKDLNVIKKNNKYGLVNKFGNFIASIKYDYIDINKGFYSILAKLKGKYGILNYNGEVLVPFKFNKGENLNQISIDTYILDNKKYLITRKGLINK